MFNRTKQKHSLCQIANTLIHNAFTQSKECKICKTLHFHVNVLYSLMAVISWLHHRRSHIPGQTVQVQKQARSFTDRRRKFRVSTVQVPGQGLNLHRESAFYVAPVAQVSALKWNLHHLWLNLRHRGASGHFRNSPADVRTKKRHSSAVAMYVHPHLQPVEGTSSDVRTKKQHSSTVSMYVQR